MRSHHCCGALLAPAGDRASGVELAEVATNVAQFARHGRLPVARSGGERRAHRAVALAQHLEKSNAARMKRCRQNIKDYNYSMNRLLKEYYINNYSIKDYYMAIVLLVRFELCLLALVLLPHKLVLVAITAAQNIISHK